MPVCQDHVFLQHVNTSSTLIKFAMTFQNYES